MYSKSYLQANKGKRIQTSVSVRGKTESGLSLIDVNGIRYHWITRQYNHPLFYMNSSEWLGVSMTVCNLQGLSGVVKNVRLIKK